MGGRRSIARTLVWVALTGCGGASAESAAAPSEPAPSETPARTETATSGDEAPPETATAVPVRDDAAAARAFAEAAPSSAAIEQFAIDPGAPATLDAYAGEHGSLFVGIRTGSELLARADAALDRVLECHSPPWTIAALVREGEAHEQLADAIRSAPFVMPGDLARQIRRASAAARAEVTAEAEERVRAALEPWAASVECGAVRRYVEAVRAATDLDGDDTARASAALATATERLAALGDARVRECIETARAGDPAHGVSADPDLAPWDPVELGAVGAR